MGFQHWISSAAKAVTGFFKPPTVDVHDNNPRVFPGGETENDAARAFEGAAQALNLPQTAANVGQVAMHEANPPQTSANLLQGAAHEVNFPQTSANLLQGAAHEANPPQTSANLLQRAAHEVNFPQTSANLLQGAAHEANPPQTSANLLQAAAHEANFPQTAYNLMQGAARAADLPQTAANIGENAVHEAVQSKPADTLASGAYHFFTGTGIGSLLTGAGSLVPGWGKKNEAEDRGRAALQTAAGQQRQAEAHGRAAETTAVSQRAQAEAHARAEEATAATINQQRAVETQQRVEEHVHRRKLAIPADLEAEEARALKMARRGADALELKIDTFAPSVDNNTTVEIAAIVDGGIGTPLAKHMAQQLDLVIADATHKYGAGRIEKLGNVGVFESLERIWSVRPRLIGQYNQTRLSILKKLGLSQTVPGLRAYIRQGARWDAIYLRMELVILYIRDPAINSSNGFKRLGAQRVRHAVMCGNVVDLRKSINAVYFTPPSIHFLGIVTDELPQFVIKEIYTNNETTRDGHFRFVALGEGRPKEATADQVGDDGVYYEILRQSVPHLRQEAGSDRKDLATAYWDLNDCTEGLAFEREGRYWTRPFEGGDEIFYPEALAVKASSAAPETPPVYEKT